MALLEFRSYRSLNKDLSRIASALERIADTLEGKLRGRVFPAGGDKNEGEVLNQTDEDFWELEQLEKRLARARGIEPGVDEDLAGQLQNAKGGDG